MHIILFALWAIVVLCNFYVGYIQMQLFNKGLIHTNWRPGTGLLNAALLQAEDAADIKMIHKGKVAFRISVLAFVPFILLAVRLWV